METGSPPARAPVGRSDHRSRLIPAMPPHPRPRSAPVRGRDDAASPTALLVVGFAVLALTAVVGCASGAEAPAPAVPAPGTSPVTDAGTDALTPSEFETLFRARAEAAQARYTEADVRFMTDMIHHHGQAVVMARMAETHGASPTVRTLAARILDSQVDEIRLMRRWLSDRGYPAPVVPGVDHAEAAGGAGAPTAPAAPHGHGAAHGDTAAQRQDHAHHHHDDHDHASMPGMLTPAQLEALDEARGLAFDRLFLAFMIEHHEGAVVMVRTLFTSDGAAQDPELFRFASDVQADQVTEIGRMRQLLAILPPDPR